MFIAFVLSLLSCALLVVWYLGRRLELAAARLSDDIEGIDRSRWAARSIAIRASAIDRRVTRSGAP